MPKKTTILIVILALITGILIFLAIRSDKSQNIINTLNNQNTVSPTIVTPYANFAFSPPQLDASTGTATKSVEIILNSGGKLVSGAQIELSYDPIVFTNVSLSNPAVPFFGANQNVVVNSVDKTQGRISYAVGIAPNDTEKTGVGPIVTINFTVNKLAGGTVSQFTFLPKSTIKTLDTQQSVLMNPAPLQVSLTAPTTPAK